MSTNIAEQHLEIARRYTDMGEEEIAELAYRKVLQFEPGNAEARQAITRIEKRRKPSAHASASRPFATPVHPITPQALIAEEASRCFAQATALREQGEIHRALDLYRYAMQRSIEGGPSRAGALAIAAQDALDIGQRSVALDWFNTAYWWSGSSLVSALAGRERVLERWTAMDNPEPEEMFRCASKWVDHDPGDAAAWHFAAELFHRNGMHTRALEFRIRASELRSEPVASREAWIRQLSERVDRSNKVPNIIFFNVANSGASAVEPILRELLSIEFGVELIGGPHNTRTLSNLMPGASPFYHWTHSGPRDLAACAALENTRILCLYRDPRDVLISHAKDPANQAAWKTLSTHEVLRGLIGTNFPGFFAMRDEWMAMGPKRVFAFRFDELKQDIPAMVRRILGFLGLPVADEQIDAVCQKYSFERLTGRSRGSDGPSVRGAYMIRKGVSGDWRSHFDQELAHHFIAHCGRFLIDWGFEPDHSWAAGLPQTLESVERQP